MACWKYSRVKFAKAFILNLELFKIKTEKKYSIQFNSIQFNSILFYYKNS